MILVVMLMRMSIARDASLRKNIRTISRKLNEGETAEKGKDEDGDNADKKKDENENEADSDFGMFSPQGTL